MLVKRVGDSNFWPKLWQEYGRTPSVALCRVPELEYSSVLSIDGDVLDHCCGDGLFATLAWPGRKLMAGCDFNQISINSAKARGVYDRLDVCDVSKKLPYSDASFDLVFNNSGLEHVKDLRSTLLEIKRVLKPRGVFVFSLLNVHYFEWWPLSSAKRTDYRLWQPFYHALTIEEWREYLAEAGMRISSCNGYFDRSSARTLARIDFAFSAFYLTGRKSLGVRMFLFLYPMLFAFYRFCLGRLTWQVDHNEGAGYFILAKVNIPEE